MAAGNGSPHNATSADGIVIVYPVLAICLAAFCLTTILGNCLVVAAVATKKYLQTPTGYLIVSLAGADLLVGVCVMPLNAFDVVQDQRWILGLVACDVYHSLDVLASTASIWALCVISVDRYIANRNPIGYPHTVTRCRISVAIAAIWIVSALLAFPAIAWWRQRSAHLYADAHRCQFTDDPVYVIFSSLISFYVPLIVILSAYWRVFLIAYRHQKARAKGQIGKVRAGNRGAPTRNETTSGGGESASLSNDDQLRVHCGRSVSTRSARDKQDKFKQLTMQRQDSRSVSATGGKPLVASTSSMQVDGMGNSNSAPPKKLSDQSQQRRCPLRQAERFCVSVDGGGAARSLPMSPRRVVPPHILVEDTEGEEESSCCEQQQGAPSSTGRSQTFRHRVRLVKTSLARYVKEQRAARTLSIVVGCFVVCWLPFFVVNILVVVCEECVPRPALTFELLTWFGHANSALNPLIYSRFSREFRRAFVELLCGERGPRGAAIGKGIRQTVRAPIGVVYGRMAVSRLSANHRRSQRRPPPPNADSASHDAESTRVSVEV